MPAITLQQIFGASAINNAGAVTFNLADLASTGLSKTGAASASEIFTALLLNLKASQATTAQEDTEWGVYVGDPFTSISRNETQIERQYPVSIYTTANLSALDPDDVVG